MASSARVSHPDPSIDCPACGYLTLRAGGAGERCRICGWRDDGRADGDPGLDAARVSFVRYRAADPTERFGLDPPAPDLPRRRRWTLDRQGRLEEHRAGG